MDSQASNFTLLVHVYLISFLFLKIVFIFARSADTDEMLHCLEYHLGIL